MRACGAKTSTVTKAGEKLRVQQPESQILHEGRRESAVCKTQTLFLSSSSSSPPPPHLISLISNFLILQPSLTLSNDERNRVVEMWWKAMSGSIDTLGSEAALWFVRKVYCSSYRSLCALQPVDTWNPADAQKKKRKACFAFCSSSSPPFPCSH